MPILENFDSNCAEVLCEKYFSIKGRAEKLDGEVDFNFRIVAANGIKYLLKTSHIDTKIEDLIFENSLFDFLNKKKLSFATPKLFKNRNGEVISRHQFDSSEVYYIRLMSWLEGRMLEDVNPKSTALRYEWGRAAGQMTKSLEGFIYPKAKRNYKWNPSETLKCRAYSKYFETENQTILANYFWDQFEEHTLASLNGLRKSINHNDLHGQNMLASSNLIDPQIVGIIDFGDAMYTESINELAIACAYAGMNAINPLEAILPLVKGYHQEFEILEEELEVLYSLIAARLLITISVAAENVHLHPENKYLQLSARPAWELLYKWKNINRNFASYSFRQVCNMIPCMKQNVFQRWVESNKKSFAKIISFEDKVVAAVDLSIPSFDLGNNSNFDNIERFNERFEHILKSKKLDIAYGGYCEHRPFYSTDSYEHETDKGTNWRTAHLGIDIWADHGTPVFAPIDGVVHSFKNNAGDRDYGPTIILEHRMAEEEVFYTLYGHLSVDSIKGIEQGKEFKKGQTIAKVGDSKVNGGWPAHLHFQVILDLLDNHGDFPGVSFPSELNVWKSICPNPYPFFNLEPPAAQIENQLLEKRQEMLGRGMSISYREPLQIVRGFGQYLYEANGRKYLDTVNNVAHVGHEHPKVVEAAQNQIGILNTNTRYLHPNIVSYAEKLLSTFPKELSVVHFTNSGSEANELAMRMARAISGAKKIIALEHGYHGNTNATVDISSYKFDGKGGTGRPENTIIVPSPNTFRGLHGSTNDAGIEYAEYISKSINEIRHNGDNVSAFIAESIQSCAGQIVPPKDFFKEVFKIVKAAGGLNIIDEVQVGFGRVGSHFWAFEAFDVIPDIVTLGKPIGNGHPLGAVICTEAVAEAFNNGMEYFNTFGGNPVSCAIGEAILDVLENEHLQSNALQTGHYLIEQLNQLQKEYPIIADVRGMGLFLGFELMKNDKPAAEECTYLVNRMKTLGILMSSDGPDHNVIKIKPPLCFSEGDANKLLKNLGRVLAEDFMQV